MVAVVAVVDACQAWAAVCDSRVRGCPFVTVYLPTVLVVSSGHLSGCMCLELTQQTPCRQTAQRHVVACLAQPEKADRDSIIDYDRLEVAVPGPQRPVNELEQVKDGILFSWATLEGAAFFSRLATVFAFVFAFLGGPIAYQTFDPTMQPAQWALAGSLGALLVTTVVTLRIYLGWSYVGERLLSATIEYEVRSAHCPCMQAAECWARGAMCVTRESCLQETGWYDGQQFVKPPEVLARDRLLGTYEVNPVMRRLRGVMLGTGASLFAACVLLVATTRVDADGMYGRSAATPRTVTRDGGIIYSKDVTDLSMLMEDDFLAAEEQAAMNGVTRCYVIRHWRGAGSSSNLCVHAQDAPLYRRTCLMKQLKLWFPGLLLFSISPCYYSLGFNTLLCDSM